MFSSSDRQPVRSSGFGNQHQNIHTDTPTSHKICGVSDKFSDSTDTDASGETEHNARWFLQQQSIAVQDLAHFVGKTTASAKAV